MWPTLFITKTFLVYFLKINDTNIKSLISDRLSCQFVMPLCTYDRSHSVRVFLCKSSSSSSERLGGGGRSADLVRRECPRPTARSHSWLMEAVEPNHYQSDAAKSALDVQVVFSSPTEGVSRYDKHRHTGGHLWQRNTTPL